MDLDYWREFYLLGEIEELADRIRGKVEALGGCEWIVLNPLDWGTGAARALSGRGAAPRGRCSETVTADARPGLATRLIGAHVKRLEDPRLVTGGGRYLDDIRFPACCMPRSSGAPTRTPRDRGGRVGGARRELGSSRPSRAASWPGASGRWRRGSRPTASPPTAWPALADSRVRFVGEPVAVVAAKTPYAAVDGCRARRRPLRAAARPRGRGRGARARSAPCSTRPCRATRSSGSGSARATWMAPSPAQPPASASGSATRRCTALPLEPRGLDRSLGGRSPHRLDRHPDPVHLSQRAGAGFRSSGESRARHRP